MNNKYLGIALIILAGVILLATSLYYLLAYLPAQTAQQELLIQQDNTHATATTLASTAQAQQASVDATSTAIAVAYQDQQNQQNEADMTATAATISWKQTFDALWLQTSTSCFVGVGSHDAVTEFRGPQAAKSCSEFSASDTSYSLETTPNTDPSYLQNLCYGLYTNSDGSQSAFKVYDDLGLYYGTAMCRQLGVSM